MKRKDFEAWLKALRSKRYAQGRKSLVTPQKPPERTAIPAEQQFCCLGVLCHTLDLDWNREYKTYGRRSRTNGELVQLFDSPSLPRSLRDELKLNNRVICELTIENDAGATFDQIADMLDGWAKEGRLILED